MMCLKHTHTRTVVLFWGVTETAWLAARISSPREQCSDGPCSSPTGETWEMSALVKEAEINTLKLAQVCHEFWPELAGQQLSFTGPDPLILEWGRSQTHKRFLSAIKSESAVEAEVGLGDPCVILVVI